MKPTITIVVVISRFGSPVREHGDRFRGLWSITYVGETSDQLRDACDGWVMYHIGNEKNKYTPTTEQNNRFLLYVKSTDFFLNFVPEYVFRDASTIDLVQGNISNVNV